MTRAGVGSARGGRQAAVQLVTNLGEWLRGVGRRRGRLSRRRPRRTKWGQRRYKRLHRRRWRSRKVKGIRLNRVAVTTVRVTGSMGVRWRSLFGLFHQFIRSYTRRVQVITHLLRPHNGIRPVKARRL